MRYKITVKLLPEYEKKPNYAYDSLKRIFLSDNRFPSYLREIGSDYFIVRGDLNDVEHLSMMVHREMVGLKCTIFEEL